jgi:photosystem II stability/assembly factor-like uncharacterized protein
MRLITWTIALMLAAGAGSATASTDWRSIGPAPPAVEAAIVADSASHTIYVASLGGGVLKSVDNGATFVAVNHGLDALTVSAMAMVPGNPNIVYVSTILGVFRTIDGGANWYGTEDVSGAVTLVIDPTDTNTVYAGLSPAGGVFKTTDAGDTWSEVTDGMGEPAVFSLALDPGDPKILYAGTQGAGAFKSIDAGGHWTQLQIDSTVWSMLVDGSNSNVVYAGTNGDGVFKSVDAGATFTRVGSPEVGVILSLAQSGEELYAGTATQGVSSSKDGGRHWVNAGVSSGLGLIVNVDDAGTVYVGTNFDGAFVRRAKSRGHEDQSDWRRLAWRQLSDCNCQNGHALAIDPADGDHIFFSTNDGGLLVTENGGRTWSDGGANGFVSRAPRGIAFDPQQTRHVYAGSFTGGGLFSSDDHGRHWHRHLFGSAALYTTGISVDPVDHSVYVATLSGDGIWKSVDYGHSFFRIDQAPGATAGQYLKLTGRGITVDPHNHRTIYAAASRGATAGVWRSQDAGHSWKQVDPSPAFSVAVDPLDPNTVYATSPAVGVLKSVDGGASFAIKSVGLPFEVTPSRTGSLQADPRNTRIIYVGTEGDGVFKSNDAGETWQPFNLGLSDSNVFGLVLDSGDSDHLFASTSSSVFRSVRARR